MKVLLPFQDPYDHPLDHPVISGGTEMFCKCIMDNFDTELVVMGIKMALTQYQLPIDPDAVKCFDEFHEKYGKYITAAQSIK